MNDQWKQRFAWLTALRESIPEALNTPRDVARFELDQYFGKNHKMKIQLTVDEKMGESYVFTKAENGLALRGGECGVLYGAYALILADQRGEALPETVQTPYYPLRMINCWDNMDGFVERGYAGRSLWFEGGAFRYDPARIRQLARMLASVGINVLCINNVNVHQPAQQLIEDMLPETARFAALLRPFGVRVMLAVDFSQPISRGVGTADPADPKVAAWWAEKAKAIYAAIPDLAGFLVKADSEHRPGPNAYGRTHAQGANMLARALKPFGGVLVWRAFVYNCLQDWRDQKTDRPCAAYDLYHPMDGQFDDNVILQVKYGPFDFQVREPVSPLFYGMPQTRLALEVQLAQEYTGHQIDLFAMPPLWRELIDDMGKENAQAIAAVSNLGRDDNWTGHPFACLNLYAFGLFAWNPDSDPEAVIRAWVKNTYALDRNDENALVHLLLCSRDAYELYTGSLGLDWMVTPGQHYGPNPYGYEFDLWGTYNRADRSAVGVDRTEKGTGYVCQYPEKWRKLYEDPHACPDKLLLFFHRLPYDFVMRDGRTLIQRLYDDHFEGARAAEELQAQLRSLPLPEPDRTEAAERMEKQISNAREWRDVVNTFFHRFCGIPDAQGRKIYD